MVSQGVPMLAHGDEFGRTQGGNNNVYCQDSEISWTDWALAANNADLVAFTGGVAALRAAHPVFRRRRFFAGRPIAPRRRPDAAAALPDIAWFTPAGAEMTEQDWDSRFGMCITAFLNGARIEDVDPRDERVTDGSFLLCFNAHHEDIKVTLPPMVYGRRWAIVVDTAAGTVVTPSSAGAGAAGQPTVAAGTVHTVPARSVLVLQRTGDAWRRSR